MRVLDSKFITEKNKREHSPVRLYTIYNYDGAESNLYYTDAEEDLIFDAQEYKAASIRFDRITESSNGSIDTTRVIVGNVNGAIEEYLQTYDFTDVKVRIRTIWRSYITDSDVYMDDVFYIDKYTSGDNVVTFTLTSKLDVLDVELPTRKYGRTYCSWIFKSSECGYSGSETVCNRTLARCRELENTLRFGGFPSIPSKTIIIQ